MTRIYNALFQILFFLAAIWHSQTSVTAFNSPAAKAPINSRLASSNTIQPKALPTTSRTRKFPSLPSRMTSSLPSFSSVQLPSSIKLQFPISNIAQAVRQVWWAFPLLLAAIPLYCVAQGTCPSMPHWWPVVSIQDIGAASSSSTPSLYRWVVSGFLSSNVWYFLSGGWLLSFSRSSGSHVGKFRPLGAWMLTAGLMSSIYHSVQAIIGVNAVTEALAYVDHGIALAAGCFYMDTCGLPSKRVWAIGLSGIACLATPNTPQAYAILHSIWHFLSAAAATLWAIEGHAGKINKQNEVRLERIMRLVHL